MRIILLGALLTSSAMANSLQVREWKNPACTGGECEIKSMKITARPTDDPRTGGFTTLVAEFTAANPELLRGYAFVQYIRGCVFESAKNGPVRFASREHLGESRPFKHPEWQVDSSQRDPIYWSTRNPGFDPIRGFEIPRNANYMATDPTKTEENRWGGRVKNIVDNRLFIKDVPTGGSLMQTGAGPKAVNSSLQFKICLHKIQDIPLTADEFDGELPDAVACLEWQTSHIYNFATKKFFSMSTVHPYCLNP